MGGQWALAGWHQNFFAKSWVVDDAAMIMLTGEILDCRAE